VALFELRKNYILQVFALLSSTENSLAPIALVVYGYNRNNNDNGF
jgi:hypothetical protein